MKVNIKAIVTLILTFLICGIIMGCSKSEKGAVFLDANGEMIGKVSSEYGSISSKEECYYDYLITAMRETVEIICRKQGVDEETAYEYLYEADYTISTKFHPDLQLNVYETLKKEEYNDLQEFAAAMTDLEGNLIASVSSEYDNENLINGSLKSRYPCSTLKPLSVYTPLLDKGEITWSSVQKDNYIKIIKASDGVRKKWPANANGLYTKENVAVADALKDSYNTVAVKWLQALTVDKSYEFLDKLGVNIEYEKELSSGSSAEEVLGNLAMGYLRQGATVVDMAGYYQMFANGGFYLQPTAVTAIHREGKELYHKQTEQKQVIRPTTASIMNKLLCNVVINGTGKDAQVEGLQLGGKTDTSNEYADNWFVGFSPQYTCAIWHGSYYDNVAPAIFSSIFRSHIANATDAEYPECEDVQMMAYCVDSGKRFTESCRRVGSGYYLITEQIDSCNTHKEEKRK